MEGGMSRQELIDRLRFMEEQALGRKLPNSQWPLEDDPWYQLSYDLDCIIKDIERGDYET